MEANMRMGWVLLGWVCSGCMSVQGFIDPFSYAPASPAIPYANSTVDQLELPSVDHPCSLAEIIDIALYNTPATQETWGKARVAAAQYGKTAALNLPTVMGSYSESRIKSTSPSVKGVTTQYLTQWGPQIQLSYTVFDFGQNRFQTEAARQALLFANYTHHRQIQSVLQQVTQNYYLCLDQLEQMSASEKNLLTAQTTFQAARAGWEVGVKDRSDLLQAQTELLQAELEQIEQNQKVITTQAQLAASMGIKSNQTITLLRDIPPEEVVEHILHTTDEWIETALSRRLDLMAAVAQIESQKASLHAKKREFWPTVTFDVTTSYPKITHHPGESNYSTTIGLTIPIFTQLSTYHSLKEAHAQKEVAQALYKQVELAITQEVVSAHAQVKNSFETLQITDRLLQTAEEQYLVALTRYRAGIGTILELIAAQNSLTHARSAKVRSTHNYLTSWVELHYAAGILERNTHRERK